MTKRNKLKIWSFNLYLQVLNMPLGDNNFPWTKSPPFTNHLINCHSLLQLNSTTLQPFPLYISLAKSKKVLWCMVRIVLGLYELYPLSQLYNAHKIRIRQVIKHLRLSSSSSKLPSTLPFADTYPRHSHAARCMFVCWHCLDLVGNTTHVGPSPAFSTLLST